MKYVKYIKAQPFADDLGWAIAHTLDEFVARENSKTVSIIKIRGKKDTSIVVTNPLISDCVNWPSTVQLWIGKLVIY